MRRDWTSVTRPAMAMQPERAQTAVDRSVTFADTPTRRTRVRKIAPEIVPVAMIVVVVVIMVMIVSVVMVMAVPVAIVGIGAAHIAAATGASVGGRDAFELRPDRCNELQLFLRQVLRRTIGRGPRAADDLPQRMRGDEARARPAGLTAPACQQRVEARKQVARDGNRI